MGNHLFGQTVAFVGVGELPVLGAGRANAALIVLAPPITALTGSIGTFDVFFQKTGVASVPSSASVLAFPTAHTRFIFTLATVSTVSTSIFAGDSLNGSNIGLQCTRISATRGWTTVPSDPIPMAFQLSQQFLSNT